MTEEEITILAAARNILTGMSHAGTRQAGMATLASQAVQAVLVNVRVWDEDERITDEHLGIAWSQKA